MEKITIGGDRLRAGGKQTTELKNYERSTFDLGYVWRSSMASGTLVPFMKNLALAGDTFEINLNCDIKTLPTLGPMFGSYKVQLDVFQIPLRLYNGKLHMNMLNIGNEMQNVHLPKYWLYARTPKNIGNIDNSQINPSSIFKYLGISGLGFRSKDSIEEGTPEREVGRLFNAIPYLAYFDIYKNYYANKQEEIGVIIHNDLTVNDITITETVWTQEGVNITLISEPDPIGNDEITLTDDAKVTINFTSLTNFNADGYTMGWNGVVKKMTEIFSTYELDEDNGIIIFANPFPYWGGTFNIGTYYVKTTPTTSDNTIPQLKTFPLKNIDDMRMHILKNVEYPSSLILNTSGITEPYLLPMKQLETTEGAEDETFYSKLSAQEGLLIKTYQSDINNNWVNTEWIDGDNGINAITAVDTSDGSFNIDTLNLSNKIYNMLNRIAISGGSYEDWQQAVYMHKGYTRAENPIYCGGLSKELTFEEIFSQSGIEGQPLGTLAGKGNMTSKHKGGHVKIRVDEASYIMGLISLTPRIDYSQGNEWDNNLRTMNDLHKPALDEIGFQDLITDGMAWFDTEIIGDIDYYQDPSYRSAGKIPAWMNYMTAINKVYGDFAIETNEMFMVLNRRYERENTDNWSGGVQTRIKDLTTYIDPSKFNFIFAETKLNAMNFWAQIKVDIKARRKMSSKTMPNL